MIIDKKGYNHYVISDIKRGYLISRVYLYYTKKQSIKLFRLYIKNI